MVEELQIARVDSHGLVSVAADQVAVADVVGPRGAAVRLAGEGRALGRGLRRPRAAQAGGRKRAEEPSVRADRLHDHQVLVLTRDGVDLDGLEQVVGRVAEHDGRGRAEAAGELADRHARPVDLAVVACEEQVHVRAVADERLVDGARAGARDGARPERLRHSPSVRIGGIARCLVGKLSRPPLVCQHPDALRGEVEDRRCHGVPTTHGGLRRRAHVRPVREEGKVHRPPG